jgi:hypothetical protein
LTHKIVFPVIILCKTGAAEPLVKTEVFRKRSTIKIYAVALVKNVPADTRLSAVWYPIPTGASRRIENDIVTDKDMWVNFNLTNPRGFVAGEYKADMMINGKVEKTLHFVDGNRRGKACKGKITGMIDKKRWIFF